MPRPFGPFALTWCVRAIAWCVPFALAAPAVADICKYVDRDGNMHYTNVAPEKGWKKLSCGVGGSPAPGEKGTKSGPSPAGFPKVDTGTQKGRDDLRRKVLTEELTTEEKLLGEARSAYANGAPPALPEEKEVPHKYAERLAKLRQAVVLHEKNIDALRKELAATR
ncbi:MAG TPA: DUF4124 domain-containing protein [Casimicrobiaceae bacterium]|nr:DUF4124 domain-containing protein [Casimicrobiaceae bacterium]